MNHPELRLLLKWVHLLRYGHTFPVAIVEDVIVLLYLFCSQKHSNPATRNTTKVNPLKQQMWLVIWESYSKIYLTWQAACLYKAL